jgi:hypothetical protein
MNDGQQASRGFTAFPPHLFPLLTTTHAGTRSYVLHRSV